MAGTQSSNEVEVSDRRAKKCPQSTFQTLRTLSRQHQLRRLSTLFAVNNCIQQLAGEGSPLSDLLGAFDIADDITEGECLSSFPIINAACADRSLPEYGADALLRDLSEAGLHAGRFRFSSSTGLRHGVVVDGLLLEVDISGIVVRDFEADNMPEVRT